VGKVDKNMGQDTTVALLKDKDWQRVDGRYCKVSYFDPFADMRDGKPISVSKSL
jgi:hypothetical protein